jgi:hypothetical protein
MPLVRRTLNASGCGALDIRSRLAPPCRCVSIHTALSQPNSQLALENSQQKIQFVIDRVVRSSFRDGLAEHLTESLPEATCSHPHRSVSRAEIASGSRKAARHIFVQEDRFQPLELGQLAA